MQNVNQICLSVQDKGPHLHPAAFRSCFGFKDSSVWNSSTNIFLLSSLPPQRGIMPAPLHRCEDCGSWVRGEHRFTHRCLLNQIDRLRSVERPERGIGQRGSLARDTLGREASQHFSTFIACLIRLWSDRPRGAVTAPFVPLNPIGANDVALMINIIRQNALRGGVQKKTALGRRQLLAAALMTAVGFTSAFAVIIDIPPLRWEIEYKSRQRIKQVVSKSGILGFNGSLRDPLLPPPNLTHAVGFATSLLCCATCMPVSWPCLQISSR